MALLTGSAPPTTGVSDVDDLRFDVKGASIPPNLAQTLPPHLGLHRRARGVCTLADVLLLPKSTASTQRTAMLGRSCTGGENDVKVALGMRGWKEDVRMRALATGAAVLPPPAVRLRVRSTCYGSVWSGGTSVASKYAPRPQNRTRTQTRWRRSLCKLLRTSIHHLHCEYTTSTLASCRPSTVPPEYE